MSERKLATIRVIEEVKDIEGADLIQSYRVGGWWVVSKKGEYQVGDLVIYCEIDSWIPTEIAPFLSKGKEPKEYEGIKGERLRTIKLKGQVSQGLLLPKEVLNECMGNDVVKYSSVLEEGDDVSEELGIIKYEPPVPTALAGLARKGGFPSYIPKSDQERIQNIPQKRLDSWKNKEGLIWEVTEKLDGSSMTVYVNGEDEGVCSRNINLKRPEAEDSPNTFWSVAIRENLLDKLRSTGLNIAIQGELIGPSIQGNPYKLDKPDFYLYNVWDITNQKWYTPDERVDLCTKLEIQHVPWITDWFGGFDSIDELLEFAEEEPSDLNGVIREGLVFKSYITQESFKVISNKFLLREK